MVSKNIEWKGSNINGHVYGFIKPSFKSNNSVSFGKPRPIKHYRRGFVNNTSNNTSSVKGMTIANMIDNPGAFIQNTNTNTKTCSLVAPYYPNLQNKTLTPDCNLGTSKLFNAENKAKMRVRSGGGSIVKQNYYQRLQEYRAARCNTFEQKEFHFDERTTSDSENLMGRCAKYIYSYDKNGNIKSFLEPCRNVSYKPINKQYAVNTAVSSSTRILNLKKESIERTSQTYKIDVEQDTGNTVLKRNLFIHKNKQPKCNPNILRRSQNKTVCVN